MNLGKLIETLENLPKSAVFEEGVDTPHSYRGNYYDLAVEPSHTSKSVGEILELLKDVEGDTFHGYKGGDFVMHGTTDVYLAYYGCTGALIEGVLIRGDKYSFMLGDFE